MFENGLGEDCLVIERADHIIQQDMLEALFQNHLQQESFYSVIFKMNEVSKDMV